MGELPHLQNMADPVKRIRHVARDRPLAGLPIMAMCTILYLANHQVARPAAGSIQTADQTSEPARYELKFQNELHGSTIITQPGQQQVFKCQVRLGAMSRSASFEGDRARRLKSASSWLTSAGLEQRYSRLLEDSQSDQLSRMLLTPEPGAQHPRPHRQLPNVTHFSIEWLKSGQSVWVAFAEEPIAIVNVTLKTQRNQDNNNNNKLGRQAKSRVEIKNTLNVQQMKLTSRFRLGHVRAADSGQYKCVARAKFLQPPVQQHPRHSNEMGGHGLIEYIEQSLESLDANLIVAPLNSNSVSGAPSEERRHGPPRPTTKTTAGYENNEFRHSARTEEADSTGGHLDDTQDGDETLGSRERPAQIIDGAGSTSTVTPSNTLFEDDEDLFRLDFGELISGQQERPPQGGAVNISSLNGPLPTSGGNPGDTMDSHANDLLVNSQPIPKERLHEAYLDWLMDGSGDSTRVNWSALGSSSGATPAVGGPNALQANERQTKHGGESLSLSSPSPPLLLHQRQSAVRFGDKKIDDQAAIGATDVSNPLKTGTGGQGGAWEDKRAEASADAGQQSLDHRHADANHALAPSSGVAQTTSIQQRAPFQPPHADPTTSSKLAKFVHKIVPEHSCYTGLGEHYRGNVSASADGRSCLNWLQVRLALSRPVTPASFGGAGQNRPTTTPAADGDHSYCRNPNSDQRGPWCFVAYSEHLDGALVTQPYLSAEGRQWKTVTSRRRIVRVGVEAGQLFVVSACQLASCSEYLWLYVVAPPFGLLVLLSCMISVLIRSIRKSQYNVIFSAAYQRHNDSTMAAAGKSTGGGLLCKFMQPRKRLVIDQCHVLPKRESHAPCCGLALIKRILPFCIASSLVPSSPRSRKHGSRGKYLDDDIFEVVDDIDWSDGQQTSTTSQSMSPSESFRLQSSISCYNEQRPLDSPTAVACSRLAANNMQHRSTLSHSKSINPVYVNERVAALDLPLSQQQQPQISQRPSANRRDEGDAAGRKVMSKSKSQVGPMFATLRCHVRNAHHQQQHCLEREASTTNQPAPCQQLVARKSSSFIDGCGSAPKRLSPARQAAASGQSEPITSNTKSGLLLSCNSSSSGGAPLLSAPIMAENKPDEDNNNKSGLIEKCSLASELPRLDASSVTIAYDVQPIYEGKFSQVQMAYIKQRKDDLAQATGRIGAQVAVCSLKEQAALDESVFHATNLRLRNLNHLNILKLLGYVLADSDDSLRGTGSCNTTNSLIGANLKCSLVYDMAHLIDLSDWLKEQCRDAFETQNDSELGLRQNLTCIAKQVALALDYLHDKNIIFKDLACRNCFLDVTRMLIKLASFNIEPEFDTGDDDYNLSANCDDTISKKLSVKSMVRPKYLLDYYVIDSRPAECQLLPLSWISLESILFNKFNKHTDIWSFGCLLYELFSLGEVAYFGYSSKQVIDSVRSNLMPPQPLLCPNGIYKLMCKCLSDIPTLRPNIKHVYEQLNLYSGQCSSFLNHHLCII